MDTTETYRYSYIPLTVLEHFDWNTSDYEAFRYSGSFHNFCFYLFIVFVRKVLNRVYGHECTSHILVLCLISLFSRRISPKKIPEELESSKLVILPVIIGKTKKG